jgi:hypothetical protein
VDEPAHRVGAHEAEQVEEQRVCHTKTRARRAGGTRIGQFLPDRVRMHYPVSLFPRRFR